MGFCDHITFELEHGRPAGTVYSTKSLYNGGIEWTVTPEGRLKEHLFHYEHNPDPGHVLTLSWITKRIPGGERFVDYHGDVLCCDIGSLDQFIARFSWGRLEWVCPASDYPEANLALLLEQGAR